MTGIQQAKNPLYEVENGQLVFKGVIGVEQSIDDNDPTLAERENQVTYALLKAIQTLCEKHQIHLVVLMFPFPLESGPAGFDVSDKRMASDCQSLGVEYFDLTGYGSLKDPAQYYPKDHHPRASWHRTVARLVAEGMDPETGRVRSHTPATRDKG